MVPSPLLGRRHRGVGLLALLATLFPALVLADEVQVSRPGYSLQAEQRGHGPLVVVFESGFGQGAGAWKSVIADLGDACTCIAYARTGLGASGSDGTPNTINKHLQDLGGVIETLAPGQSVVLVGHSYGGLLATEYARAHPDRLRGLVLVDPATLGQRRDTLRADRRRVRADDRAMLAMLPPPLAADYRLLMGELERAPVASTGFPAELRVALLTSTQVAPDPFVFEETAAGKSLWKRQHATLFAEFSHGTHQYIATGHNIHREDPKAVAEAIRSLAK